MAVNPIDIFDMLSDSSEGRRVGFETFLNNFSKPKAVGDTTQRGPINNFNRQNYSNLIGGAENRFFGQQGQRIQEGKAPQSFTDFLNKDFNIGRESRRAPSSQLGTGTSRFASPARFLFNQ